MHLNVTLKGLLQAFIFAAISCIGLIGLPASGANPHLSNTDGPSAIPAYSSQFTYYNNYRKWHPYSPLKQPLTTAAAGPLWRFANNQQFITGGLGCIPSFVDRPENAVD